MTSFIKNFNPALFLAAGARHNVVCTRLESLDPPIDPKPHDNYSTLNVHAWNPWTHR
jgi:hypothetical protein